MQLFYPIYVHKSHFTSFPCLSAKQLKYHLYGTFWLLLVYQEITVNIVISSFYNGI